MTILRVDPQDPGRSVADQIHEDIRRIVSMLREDRATTKIMLSDAVGIDAAFDRKLLSFYDEVATLLETSLKDGQALGVVAAGDVKLYAYLTVGAMKELLYQVVMREWEYPEARIVEEIFAFLRRGYLRVDAGVGALDDGAPQETPILGRRGTPAKRRAPRVRSGAQ